MDRPLQRVPDFQLMLTDEQFRAIGHMMAQWAFLESQINDEIKWLLGRNEHRGKRINFQARFSTRADNWLKLATKSYRKRPKLIKDVQRITGNANNIKPERDDIAHGNLGSSGIFFKLRDGEVRDISDTAGKPEYIENLACRISSISALLFKHQLALRGHFRGRP
jgi:hypothetical protein